MSGNVFADYSKRRSESQAGIQDAIRKGLSTSADADATRVNVTVSMTRAQKRKVKAWASAHGVTVSGVIQQVIDGLPD